MSRRFFAIVALAYILMGCSLSINIQGNVSGAVESLSISTPLQGMTIAGFEVTVSGRCDDRYELSATDPNGISVVSLECAGRTLTGRLGISPTLSTSKELRSITLRNGIASSTLYLYSSMTCPSGMSAVPGNAAQDIETSDFCISTFEMKNVGGVPTSEAPGTPWLVEADGVGGAEQLCASQGMSLVTNAQWQTVARNVFDGIQNKINDNGVWRIPRGVSNEGSLLPASNNSQLKCFGLSSASDDCSGLSWGTGLEQRRVLVLTTGNILWDFAGNAAEWVNESLPGTLNPDVNLFEAGGGIFVELNNLIRFPPNSLNRKFFGPSDATLNSTRGIGKLKTSSSGGYAGGLQRGGDFNDGDTAGIFAANLDHARSMDGTAGFRCTKTPVTVP